MHLETGARTFADEVVGDDLRRNARLERIHAAIDWDRIGAIVGELPSSREGRKAYPAGDAQGAASPAPARRRRPEPRG